MRRGWFGAAGAWALLLAACLFAVPAATAPFVTLGKFGQERASGAWDIGSGLWQFGHEALAPWIWFCGVVAPLLLLFVLLVLRWARTRGRALHVDAGRLAARLEFWSMPEVQVLGVLVAFFKLGDVVDVSVNLGLWCYGAAALCLLAAWRAQDQEASIRPGSVTEKPEKPR